MASPIEPAGALVIRVWIERGSPDGLRARITRLTDLPRGEPVTHGAATIDEICVVVRSWLEAFVDGWERP